MPELAGSGDGVVVACGLCGRPAAGPCARCRAMVCADCCTLSQGGLTAFAICTRCERGGANLSRAWLGLAGWLALLLLALAGAAGLLFLARG